MQRLVPAHTKQEGANDHMWVQLHIAVLPLAYSHSYTNAHTLIKLVCAGQNKQMC